MGVEAKVPKVLAQFQKGPRLEGAFLPESKFPPLLAKRVLHCAECTSSFFPLLRSPAPTMILETKGADGG